MSLFISYSFAATNTLDPSDSDGWNLPNEYSTDTNREISNKTNITRTVITAVPQTGPKTNIVWIIIATLAIFGGYIYIKKRADI